MAGSMSLEKRTLRNLHPDMMNAFIVGIIIAKQSPKKVLDERAVWNFTFRDSPQDYINVACWGSKEAVFLLNEKFHVGDVVEVVKPKIQIRRVDDHGEQFRPMVTSPFTLVLSEQSAILVHEGADCATFLRLLHYPTKPLAKYVALADVHRKGSMESGALRLDILGAVKNVGNVRTIKTKDDRELQVREVIIFDHTCPELRFSIFDPNWNLRASAWSPRTTILFMTDMRAEWSNFHRSVIAVITARTIITEDPIGAEANALRRYAQTVPIQTNAVLEALVAAVPANTIQNVMNISQFKEKLKMETPNCQSQTQALIFAFVTFFDLDGDPFNLFSLRCGHCEAPLSTTLNNCENLECPVSSGRITLEPLKTFQIKVSLSDHTGTLEGCRLSGKFAEQTLKCDVNTFLNKTVEEKTTLKWKFLMERCAVRLVAFRGLANKVAVLDISHVSPFDVAGKIPHF